MELFTERLSALHQTSQETKLCTLGDSESVGCSITEFHYDPDGKSTFLKLKIFLLWFFKELADDWKVRLLLRKLGLAKYNRYSNYILPKLKEM